MEHVKQDGSFNVIMANVVLYAKVQVRLEIVIQNLWKIKYIAMLTYNFSI